MPLLTGSGAKGLTLFIGPRRGTAAIPLGEETLSNEWGAYSCNALKATASTLYGEPFRRCRSGVRTAAAIDDIRSGPHRALRKIRQDFSRATPRSTGARAADSARSTVRWVGVRSWPGTSYRDYPRRPQVNQLKPPVRHQHRAHHPAVPQLREPGGCRHSPDADPPIRRSGGPLGGCPGMPTRHTSPSIRQQRRQLGGVRSVQDERRAAHHRGVRAERGCLDPDDPDVTGQGAGRQCRGDHVDVT